LAENIDLSIFIASTSMIIPVQLRLNSWQKIHTSIFPPTTCTEIVVFGDHNTIASTLPRFTKFLRNSLYIPVIVGLILGGLSKSTNNS
jgi:hypothetical protein